MRSDSLVAHLQNIGNFLSTVSLGNQLQYLTLPNTQRHRGLGSYLACLQGRVYSGGDVSLTLADRIDSPCQFSGRVGLEHISMDAGLQALQNISICRVFT